MKTLENFKPLDKEVANRITGGTEDGWDIAENKDWNP